MKATRQPLRAKRLSQADLEKANGGRGTFCGTAVHCDQCGASWGFCVSVDPWSGQCYSYGLDANCPYCGASNWS